MTAKELGEQPAWPLAVADLSKTQCVSSGMTIRMELAGRAMQATLTVSAEDFVDPDYRRPGDNRTNAEVVAERSFKWADAMLEQAAKEQTCS